VELFRGDLLEGVAIGLVGPGRGAIGDVLGGLGADVRVIEVVSDEEAPAGAEGVAALVVDAGVAFGDASGEEADELAPLRIAADRAWIATRAVANAAWIAPQAPGGKVIFVAPRPQDGVHAEAARAALENLARTLSIEWARYGIRTTTISPHQDWSDGDVANLVAYLVSPAGDYFSGARLG
jgi:NAD(P)-dependent dehydrogenase (short-subunit alcohol dehydrogenase family)